MKPNDIVYVLYQDMWGGYRDYYTYHATEAEARKAQRKHPNNVSLIIMTKKEYDDLED